MIAAIQTERAVLSVVIQQSEYIQMLKNYGITKECFSDPLCRRVFGYVIQSGLSSLECLVDRFPEQATAIVELSVAAVSGANMPEWVRTLKEYACRRRMAGIADELLRLSNSVSDADYRDRVLPLLQRANEAQLLLDTVTAKDMLTAVREYRLEQETEPTIPEYIAHGLPYDSEIRHGRREIFTLGAVPGCGKTNLALSVMLNSIRAGRKVCFFCQEMPFRDLFRRIVANASDVPLGDLIRHNGGIAATNAENDLYDLAKRNLYLLRGAGDYEHSAEGIRREIRNFYGVAGGIDLIVIDYLQTMRAPRGSRFRDRREIIDSNLEDIKAIAAEYNAPVLLLSQLNRDSQKDGKLGMAALKESAHIEEVSSIIAIMSRKEEGRRITFDCVKNRNGRRFKIDLEMLGEFARFKGIEHKYGAEDEQR